MEPDDRAQREPRAEDSAEALSGGPGPADELANVRARVDRLEREVAALQQRIPAATPLFTALPVSAAAPREPVLTGLGEGGGAASATAMQPGTKAVSVAPPPFPKRESQPEESLENRLGSQVFNRVGIIALLFGTAWFLKLAIDNQWIGPIGRILAGLIAGTAIVLWSESFRRRGYSAFSFSLKAIGSGVLYLSLWAAFQLYHLLPSAAALGAMILVTAWNAYMAWAQNSQMLAAYALAGGLLTPILLSTGGDHEIFLFTYLLAIDVATVALVRLRSWPKLLLAALPATIAYFIGWYAEFFYINDSTAKPVVLTSFFITLFFLTFASVPVRRPTLSQGPDPSEGPGSGEGPDLMTLSHHPEAGIGDIFLPILNAAFASLAFYSILQDSGQHDALAWMTLAFGAFFLAWMRLPQSRLGSAIHLSLAVVFLTITIPIKATGRWITLGWLVEAVSLLFISARLLPSLPASIRRVLRLLASACLALGVAALLFLPFWIDSNINETLFNRRFATGIAGLAALGLAAWIALHPLTGEHVERERGLPTWLQIAAGSTIAFNLVALHTGVREIDTFWNRGGYNYANSLQIAVSISAFLMLYGGTLLAVGFWRRSAFIRWQALILIVLTIGKTFLYDMRNLSQGYRVVSFLGLGVLLMGVSFAYQKDWLSLKEPEASKGLR